MPLVELPMRSRFDLRPSPPSPACCAVGLPLFHAHTPRRRWCGGLAAMSGVPLVYHVHSPTCQDTATWRNRFNAMAERGACPA